MSQAIIRQEFNYSPLGKETRGRLVSLANNIRRSTKSHIENAIQMGMLLNEAIELLARNRLESSFKGWVERECGFSLRTAYNYINVFNRFGECATVAQNLTLGGLYVLSPDDVPEEAVQTAINLAQKGERVTAKIAYELKARFSDEGSEDDEDENPPGAGEGDHHAGAAGEAAAGDQDPDPEEAGPAFGDAPDRAEDTPVGDLVAATAGAADTAATVSTEAIESEQLIRNLDAAFKVLASDLGLLHKQIHCREYDDLITSLDLAYGVYKRWKRRIR